jgi:glutamyl/glutaminyl-tRNA synthetase
MSSRRKPVDKSADFKEFIEQTSDYLLPSTTKVNSPEKNKQLNKQTNSKSTKRKKKVYIGDLFDEPVAKERMVNTTLQLPESLNSRLKEFCSEFGRSKNEVIKTLVEALLDEKGF